MVCLENEPLAPHTWYKIGGVADRMLMPASLEELQAGMRDLIDQPITVLSSGTNVLVHDDGIRGTVLNMTKLTEMTVAEEGGRFCLIAEAGVSKARLTKEFLKRSLSPALFLSGIPGDLGGGVVMNAGVSEAIQPREFCEIVDWIETVDRSGELHRIEASQISWSYRKCQGWGDGVIYRAQLSWPMHPQSDIGRQVREATRSRLARQPLEFPSCGSVFVNPPGDKAGRLIESVGLKGHRCGGAQISEKHANFIINSGGAKARDVRELIDLAREKVKSQTGIELRTEVRFLGG